MNTPHRKSDLIECYTFILRAQKHLFSYSLTCNCNVISDMWGVLMVKGHEHIATCVTDIRNQFHRAAACKISWLFIPYNGKRLKATHDILFDWCECYIAELSRLVLALFNLLILSFFRLFGLSVATKQSCDGPGAGEVILGVQGLLKYHTKTQQGANKNCNLGIYGNRNISEW